VPHDSFFVLKFSPDMVLSEISRLLRNFRDPLVDLNGKE
jgi:hypothetical protein